jgi:hypothetical protein
MTSLNRLIIKATRPVRYSFDRTTYSLFGHQEHLIELKDKYKGKAVLVVGNGPSLNNTPLDDFASVPSIGMNKIDLIYSRTSWRPSIVVCLNNIVAKQNQDAFARSPVPVFVAWKARWLINRSNRQKLRYFNTNLTNDFMTDPSKGFGSSATVTYIALQMAYWMGANPVILFGVDHNFKYEGPEASYQKREGPDVNHFDPNYFKSGSIWGTPDLLQSEEDYRLAREAFDRNGRSILDATVGGKLSIFEKISLDRARHMIEEK